MIGQNRQTAPDQHGHKKEVEEMTVAHPNRETMRTGKVIGIDLRDRWNMGQTDEKYLDPCRNHRQKHQKACNDQDGGPDPNAKTSIGGVMYGGMRRIKLDH
jgi:hypothetical protein